MTAITEKINQTICISINQEANHWLKNTIAEFKANPSEDIFFFRFASVARAMKLQKGSVRFNEESPEFFIHEATRILLLLQYIEITNKTFDVLLQKIRTTADTAEIISLNKGLIFYPYSEYTRLFAEEGLRSNMKNIFESVALDNAFAAKHFNEVTWNQMILKALFIEAPIYRIHNFENRTNDELNRMTNDYALERIVASRKVNPELWRCIYKISDSRIYDHWLKIFASADEIEKNAILCTLPNQKNKLPIELEKIQKENKPKYNWSQIGQILEQQRKAFS